MATDGQVVCIGPTAGEVAPTVESIIDTDVVHAETVSDGLPKVRSLAPDVVLISDDVPDQEVSGAVGTVSDVDADPAVLVLTTDDDLAVTAIEAGARDVATPRPATVLGNRIERLLDPCPTDADDVESRRKIKRLHAVASNLATIDSEGDIYDLAVDAAEGILEFDSCYVGVVEGREIRPLAANDDPLLEDPVIMTVDEGVAGRTVRNQETYVVDNATEDPDADPVDDAYRSALSIPIGEVGVFQAVASEYGAFSETDRELGELLAAHVAEAVQRVRYEDDLRRERDRFAALFENIPDAALRYAFEDDEMVIEGVNPAFESIFGYDREEALGKNLDEFVVPENRRDHGRTLNEAVRNGERLDTEVERITADGPQPFLLRSAPMSTEDHEQGYIIYTDILKLKEREQELEHQNERLEQFASIVSHDLRSPLNVATGYLESTVDDPDPTLVRESLRSLRRMEALIEDLLTMARQGDVVSDTEPVECEDVVADAWRTVETDQATLERGDLPRVEADRSRLRELLENLFRNAVEHNEGDVTIEVGALPAGIYVEDDGRGIPEGQREKVFESGFSTAEDGTGFGLAIVGQIATAHGWDVHLAEGDDGGARFEFTWDDALAIADD